jgi:hypothetical protein
LVLSDQRALVEPSQVSLVAFADLEARTAATAAATERIVLLAR